MARKKTKRRSFGSIVDYVSKGHSYKRAKYKTPDAALAADPTLPKYQTKTVAPQYEDDLVAWLNAAQNAIRAGVWKPERKVRAEKKASTETFEEYYGKWVEARRKPDGDPLSAATKAKYLDLMQTYVFPVIGSKTLSSITPQDIRDWYENFPMKNGVGATVRKNSLSVLKSVLRTAASNGEDGTEALISSLPVTVKPKKVKVKHEYVISTDEERELIRAAMQPRLAISIDLAGDGGLREGEICGAQRQDVSKEKQGIYINHALKEIKSKGVPRKIVLGPPKSEKGKRFVPLSKRAFDRLEEHLEEYVGEKKDAYILTTERGKNVAPQSLRNAYLKARKAAPRVDELGGTFHDLRHTALTTFAAHGATLSELRDIAGHETLATVGIYQQISQQHLDKVMDSLNQTYEAKTEAQPETAGESTPRADSSPLIGLLTAMRPEAIGAALTKMSEEQKKQILTALPPETVQQVLLATLSK